MRISFISTNPCHLWPLAEAVARTGSLGAYYSGYPAWKLGPPGAAAGRVVTNSFRTNIVYGLLRFVPSRFRPPNRSLFLWQDHGFDRWAASALKPCDFVHGMPGQCLETFRAARKGGVLNVLNHATGPVRTWVEIMRPEYERVGLSVEAVSPYDSAYFEREAEEYALADFHCVASRIVAEQLSALGIAEHRIWRVPYGADGALFSPEGAKDGTMGNSTGGHILFAGQFGLRKGTKTLLAALRLAEQRPWSLHCFGARLSEADADIGAYRGAVPIRFHGAVSQQRLAAAFRSATVLVLPSLEEGFGLVVPQALACGLPCVVSDRVGAADLIRHRENGSIVPHDSPEALYEEIAWWIDHPRRVPEPQPWEHCASALIQQSALALKATEIKEVSLS